jgi:hypothetical protein
MPLNNSEVVTAFFESYLTIRKSDWSLNVDDPINSGLPYKPAAKLETCIELIQKLKNTESLNQWTVFFNELMAKAKADYFKAKEARSSYLGFGRLFVDRPLLLETLCAALSYIHFQMTNMQKNGLTKEVIPQTELDHFTQILEDLKALNGHDSTIDNYFEFHFNEVIKQRDSESKALEEKYFSDFETNVLNKKRMPTICNKLADLKDRIRPIILIEAKKTDAEANTASILAALPKPTRTASKVVEISAPAEVDFPSKDKSKKIILTRAKKKAQAALDEEKSNTYSPSINF